MDTYYLSSMDSYALEKVRRCDFVEYKVFDTGKPCVVARLHPPVPGQVFGVPGDIEEVVLACRHEGDDIRTIREFPCFVHVARVLDGIRLRDVVKASELQNFARGELYRTTDDAENHVFDRST